MTNIDLTKFKNDLLFLPLGGSGEIGMNCNLYHYKGKWLVVDLGVGFINTIPGVDIVVPDISFLKKQKNNIVGLVITHIHEDHIGAIEYLLEELNLPIFCSEFAAEFLKEKLSTHRLLHKVKINEVEEGDKINLDPFDLEFIGLNHSTPEMNAILIKTDKGNILHTGDWRFDETPVIGHKTDKEYLKRLGDKQEILATVCDSTNIFTKEKSHSENDLLESLTNIIQPLKGMVVVTIFASNVSRIKTICAAAKACKREIVITGKSLFRIIKIAKKLGYIPNSTKFLYDNEIDDYKRKEILVIATGCQGETLAATNKMADGMHLTVKLQANDTIIFSSKMIPGNEKDIISLYNKLSEKNINIITEKDHFVHVSGHFSAEELKEMYNLTRPKIAIAVHGENLHLLEHQKIAKECGIKNVLKGKNGQIIKIDGENSKVIDEIELKYKAVDGNRLLAFDSEIIKKRKKLMEVGAVFVNLIINKKNQLVKKPIIKTPGGYDLERDHTTHEILIEDITEVFNRSIKQITSSPKKKFKLTQAFTKGLTKENLHFIDQQIRTVVNRIYKIDTEKKPVIEIELTFI